MGLFIKNVIAAGVGITLGGLIGYYQESKFGNAQIPIKKVDMYKIVSDLEKDLEKTYQNQIWNRVCMVSQNKVVQGAVIGLGAGLVTYNVIPYVGATILSASPQLLTYIKNPGHVLNLEKLKEIVNLRQAMRFKTAMKIVNDPELSESDIIAMFKRRLNDVRNMVNGSAKTRTLLTLISLTTFVILANVQAFTPLIRILRDLMLEANLNEETSLELNVIHQNQTLQEIIKDLVKNNQNSTHLDF